MTYMTDSEREIVLGIVSRLVPGVAVKAFGSRVRQGAKKWSDLDLALMTEAPIPPAVMMMLRLELSESDLPWRVDVLDWFRASESFKASIAADLTSI